MTAPDATDSTTSVLCQLGQARDPTAWAELIGRHGTNIQRLAHRLITDQALAEDAVQEVFLALRDGARRFTPRPVDAEAHAIGWVMRVAWTTIMLTARQRRRRSVREVPLQEAQVVNEVPGDDSPELAALLTTELERLPERHRVALTLHYLIGLGYPELAATLQVTISDARVRVHRALAALRTRLAPRLPELSVTVLAAHLQALPGPSVPSDGAAGLHQLLTSSRQAPHGGHPLLTGLSVISSVAVVVVLGLALTRPWSAAAPAMAAEASDTPPPIVAPKIVDAGELEVHLELSDSSFADFQDICTRIFRIPVRYVAQPGEAMPPPVTLIVDHTRFKYVADLLCKVTGLDYSRDAAGGYVFSHQPSALDPLQPKVVADTEIDPQATFQISVSGVTGQAFMQAYYHAGGGTYRHTFDDRATGLVWFRAGITDPRRQMRLLDALLNGDGSTGGYQQVLRTIIIVPAFSGTMAEACALLSRCSALHIRLDDQSGPMPRITLGAGRMVLMEELNQLADAAHVAISQSTDGIVLYRPATWAYRDQDELTTSPGGVHYQEVHPRWWWYQTLASGAPLAIDPRLIDRLLAPHWIEMPVSAVADDLRHRLGVPVVMRVDPATAARPILLATDERALGDVLCCLSSASGCSCHIADDRQRVIIEAGDCPTSGPGTPPTSPPAPPPVPLPAPASPLPDTAAPAPSVMPSGG